MANEEKYSLIGVDGNAYAIMAYVIKALHKEGVSALIGPYKEAAMRSDYDNLVAKSIHYLEKANEVAKTNEGLFDTNDILVEEGDEVIDASNNLLHVEKDENGVLFASSESQRSPIKGMTFTIVKRYGK